MESDGVPEGWGVEDREILLDVEEIHSALLERNQQHFHQAAETPFGHGFLYDLVGYSGISKVAQDIEDRRFLEGFDLESILPETRQVIAEMAMP